MPYKPIDVFLGFRLSGLLSSGDFAEAALRIEQLENGAFNRLFHDQP
jgi:hypothetical protein